MTAQLSVDDTGSGRPAGAAGVRPLGHRIRVPNTAELVAAQLRRKIVAVSCRGRWLPSEAALMAEFAVSRPTLREAFRVLESESLISIRRGAPAVPGCSCRTGTWRQAMRAWCWNTGALPSRTSTTPGP